VQKAFLGKMGDRANRQRVKTAISVTESIFKGNLLRSTFVTHCTLLKFPRMVK